jgi:hypothetical protein
MGEEDVIQPDKANRRMGRICEKTGEKMVYLDNSCSPLALSPPPLPCL